MPRSPRRRGGGWIETPLSRLGAQDAAVPPADEAGGGLKLFVASGQGTGRRGSPRRRGGGWIETSYIGTDNGMVPGSPRRRGGGWIETTTGNGARTPCRFPPQTRRGVD